MIEELRKDYKKRLIKKDQEETDKIFNAIHEQAYWKRLEAENKRMLSNMDKELNRKRAKRKELKQQLFEDTVCFVLMIIALIPTIMLLVVLCY